MVCSNCHVLLQPLLPSVLSPTDISQLPCPVTASPAICAQSHIHQSTAMSCYSLSCRLCSVPQTSVNCHVLLQPLLPSVLSPTYISQLPCPVTASPAICAQSHRHQSTAMSCYSLSCHLCSVPQTSVNCHVLLQPLLPSVLSPTDISQLPCPVTASPAVCAQSHRHQSTATEVSSLQE